MRSDDDSNPSTPPPKLLDQLKDHLRTRHYSRRTEQTYSDWARRYIIFHGKRHPRDLGPADVEAFLSHLAVDRNVAASTQNQAKAALLYLYKHILKADLPWLDEIVQAKRAAAPAGGNYPARSDRITRQSQRHDVADLQLVVRHRHAYPRMSAPPRQGCRFRASRDRRP